MKKTLTIILMLLAFTACKRKSDAHLPIKTMQNMLLDMHLAEAYATTVRDSLHRPGAKNYDSLDVYYASIYAHYNITQQQFKQSLEWYKAHPVEMDSMYVSMLASVSKWQSAGKPPAKQLH